jgi:mono/diheme cytochrome c family protein
MRRLWWLVLAAGCSREIAGGRADGPQIFTSACAACHGPIGKPDAGMVARYNVRDLTAPEFRARVTPELVAAQVRSGSKNGLMPPFAGALSEEQIRAVAEYVTALPAPPPRPPQASER